jgi:hypothetical protein
MLITLGNPRALHHANGAFLHAAIAGHCQFARRAIRSRHQLPSRSSAQRAILQRHNPAFVEAGLSPALLLLPKEYGRNASSASHLLWENCGRLYSLKLTT